MADLHKVNVMRWMLPPTDIRDVGSFIGMCSFNRRFIPNFPAVAKPLIRLIKKFAKFEWNKECQAAFDFFSDRVTKVPVWAYLDTSKQDILYACASDNCIVACLWQEWDTEGEMKSYEQNENPIHYLLQKLTASETNWPTIEKEALLSFMMYRN